ncbi:DUF6284 family protein [Streptomyces virginiae]|uniref:DUF6284 family protein n=1 Tax=Streptomyces virginiae TaxID=1961 RepID=UPI0005272F02|nr:DUF6284 family protein [Streptomyces virginiae]
MKSIAALQDLVTPWSDGLEPSDAELDAIEQEMPLILARVDLLDAQIMTIDRPAVEPTPPRPVPQTDPDRGDDRMGGSWMWVPGDLDDDEEADR